ncbi:MAG TPA: NAD(+)/NADH kinase [Candidatus Pullilachnospira stercoravium]|uniref:NAD kinase n=1 Tax=Candidatus Pullilachnospira stercoravium TaxID=2840913 RepID=A0A9D1T6K7_9FIRM|nr:NAD(+)/NADH kinase [Candidatus Pullilachnospira stercoravium]
MDKFTIIANSVKDRNFVVSHRIAEYLRNNGKECLMLQDTGEEQNASYHYTDPDRIPDDTQCIIVLGGDGTLLQAARDVVDKDIPLFGINMGTLGYLAEIDQHSIYPALDRLMSDRYTIERRMMLSGTVYKNDKVAVSDVALNDIVIGREGPLRVVRFNNYVNGTFLNSYKADGIIVSTPTGSTGYSLSAGGPIISPAASMILMTPLAPHTLNTRSIVFSPDDRITVEIGEGRDQNQEHGMASFDGDTSVSMVTGDRIVITRSKKDTRIIKINNISFLETLREKMSNS